MRNRAVIVIGSLMLGSSAAGQSFVNWESPHVSPIDVTPDGQTLLVVNTADNRLELFDLAGSIPVWVGSVPVGLDPVSVRARTDDEAWVVNHISDSISIVSLASRSVRRTLATGDEPCDVVFAGKPQRAFVSVSQLNQVRIFDVSNLDAAPLVKDIAGEDPRALATDGARVYAAIFESGNRTTILPQTVVSSPVNPYPGDANPPPNSGAAFDPPITPGLPAPPDVSLIVRKSPGDQWLDDNGGDWSAAVTWDLHDHDVAVLNAATLSLSYITGLMNANMSLAEREGELFVIGTDAINDLRFEPNVAGIFVRVVAARMDSGAPVAEAIVDLNPHLDYSTPTVSQPSREQSIGDPRGLAFDGLGRAFITGMGSNNVVVTDAGFARLARLEVGQGPTGIRYDARRDRMYIVNKFEASVSVVDAAALAEVARVPFHDPTPQVIRDGRPFLYDTHQTSGLGQASCGSCHIDGRMDQLSWDLGAPNGAMKPFNQVCNFGFGGCEDWHPMKGPMATQSLIGIIGTGPLHWRADRENLAAFNPAFVGLLGDDVQLTAGEMNQFNAFIATLRYPPNPNRNIDNTLKTSLPTSTGTGNPASGSSLFLTANLDGIECVTCHAQPTGTNGQLTSANLLQETQSMKIPQLRNMHEKTGFLTTSMSNNRGFGFIHDGSVPTLFEFLQFPGFQFGAGATGDQQRRDVEAFLFSFSTDTHAGVGVQTTARNGGGAGDDTALISQMITLASSSAAGLVVKGVHDGVPRGWHLAAGGQFQSDRAGETMSTAAMLASAVSGAEKTYTLVPAGSQVRIGIDRDLDGFFDQDEIDACSNPADAASTPDDPGCVADLVPVPDGDGFVDVGDLLALLAAWGASGGAADIDCSGQVEVGDLLDLLAAWGACD
jgi:DNA-binding beta-propeller fold protein YncE